MIIGKRANPTTFSPDVICVNDPGVAPRQATLRWNDNARRYVLYHGHRGRMPTLLNGRAVDISPVTVEDVIQVGQTVMRLTDATSVSDFWDAQQDGPPIQAAEVPRVLILSGPRRGTSLPMTTQDVALVGTHGDDLLKLRWNRAARRYEVTAGQGLVYRDGLLIPLRRGLEMAPGDVVQIGLASVMWRIGTEAPQEKPQPTARPVATRTPSPQARVHVFRHLATLQHAGVRIDHSLQHIAEHADDVGIQQAARTLLEGVRAGQQLSAAAESCPRLLNPLHIALLRVGEDTGQLDKVLARLADFEEQRWRLRQQVQSTLIYPLCMAIVSLAMVVLAPPFLMQNLIAMLKESGHALPWITRGVITVSDLVRNPLAMLVAGAGLAALIAFCSSTLRSAAGRLRLTALALRLPYAGPLSRAIAASRFGWSLSLMLGAGLGVTEAVELAAVSSGNAVLEARGGAFRAALQEGTPLSRALDDGEFFPPAFVRFVECGAETGCIDDMLARAVKLLEQDVETSLQSLLVALEPLLLAVLGVIVGVTVVALLLPLAQLVNNL